MLLEDGRVDGGEGLEVIADTGVGDDDVEAINALGLNVRDGAGGVGLGFVVDLDENDFAVGAGGKGGEVLGGGILRVADAGDDGCRGAGEIGLDKA